MNEESITKYLPIVASGLALILGLSNSRKINSLETKTANGFRGVSEVITNVEASLTNCNDNFKIIQRDINKIGHFVGFKGRLGVND